jgi:hypothetical protein
VCYAESLKPNCEASALRACLRDRLAAVRSAVYLDGLLYRFPGLSRSLRQSLFVALNIDHRSRCSPSKCHYLSLFFVSICQHFVINCYHLRRAPRTAVIAARGRVCGLDCGRGAFLLTFLRLPATLEIIDFAQADQLKMQTAQACEKSR